MRVMVWSPVFWPSIGGVQSMVASLLLALKHRGHEFLVITACEAQGLPSEGKFEGIEVHRLPFASVLRDVDALMSVRKRIIRLKQEFGADLLHTTTVSASDFFHLTTSNTHPMPWLVTLLGAWPSGLNSVVRRVLKQADWVVGCSDAILQRGRELVPEISSHASVIYNAQKPGPIRPLPLASDPPVLLYLGRLSHEKGVDIALAAFASLIERFPSIRMIVAGDGPEREALERQTRRRNLVHAVRFLGWVSQEEVPALVNTTSMLVLPSRGDAFPLVGLQAALMERPVVATCVGGLPEMVSNGETGILVEPESPDALAEAVALLLERPRLAQRMGKSARRHVLQTFHFEQVIDSYDQLYHRLANSRLGRREARHA
jgi:glycogen(starch) synthase